MSDWKEKAAALAESLMNQGKLWSPEWIVAVQETPRHVFVPYFYEQDPATGEWRVVSGDDDGLDRVYSNRGLFTKIGPDPVWGYDVGLSSTSTPSLMTRMLEMLDVQDGHRVLEIGTGTGYNAALLCHRLGDSQVVSVDIADELVEKARDRLNQIGYQPTLVAADGANGVAEHGPYDRLIATCSVPRVPWAWIEQLRDGGLALMDIKRTNTAGNLVLLQRNGERAEGRFDARWAGFMSLRSGENRQARPPKRDRGAATPRPSSIGYVRPWDELVPWFMAALSMPSDVVHGHSVDQETGEPGDVFVYSTDGSWAEISAKPDQDGAYLVWEAGPRQLWRSVEQGYDTWDTLGRPGWSRLGLTVTSTGQRVWIDKADSEVGWDL